MSGKAPKRKTVNYKLIPEFDESKKRNPIYATMSRIIQDFHPDLEFAKIALVWRFALKPDKDNRIVLGTCRLAGDLNKEFAPFDFVITLNRDHWDRLSEEQREALIDHELCHAAPDISDKTGLQKRDERDRRCWRIRGHDIEEFRDIVRRHGCYKRDLEDFIRAGADKLPPTLFDEVGKPQPVPVTRTDAEPPAAPITDPNKLLPAHKPESWRAVPLLALAIPTALVAKLNLADIRTVGDLHDWLQPDAMGFCRRLTDIDGIGEAKAEKIEAALEQFWTEQKGKP